MGVGKKWGVALLGVGVALALIAVSVDYLAFPAFLHHKVTQQVRLVKDGDTFKKWENIPIPIHMKVYIFNLTNPDEFAAGGKPVVDEIGPYVYQQTRKKIHVSFLEENDTIGYQQVIVYHFRPDLSNGTEEDEITMVNLPFVGLGGKLDRESVTSKMGLREIMQESHPDVKTVIETTVGEFLFKGIYIDFMGTLAEIKGEELLKNNTFGLYYGKNGTTHDWLTVYSGVQDNTKFGNIATFNHESKLSFWTNDSCNMINGSDGALFPPFVTRDRRLDIFSPELCRSLSLEYDSETEIQGLTGYRFTLPERVLEDPRINEENECFCTFPGKDMENCPKRGAYQLESCRKGAPVVVSLPHFLDGDPEYRENVAGLEPDRLKHETVITLEPTTGVLLEARKRIQINLHVFPFKYLPALKKLSKVILPIVWVDESAVLTEESANRIKGKLIKPQIIVGYACWGLFGLGCLLILVAIILLVFFPTDSRRGDYKPPQSQT